MQGAERGASVLHRLAMRRHLVTRKSSAEAWSARCRRSVVRFDAVGLEPTAIERESHSATQTNRPGYRALLAVALWASSSKHPPRGRSRVESGD